jgi:hypothetical protein
MKYKVTGINHDKGARMTLELEAESKAAAERKAHNAGMDVQHVEDITAGDHPHAERATHRGEHSRGGSGWLGKLVTLLVLAAIVYIAYGYLKK